MKTVINALVLFVISLLLCSCYSTKMVSVEPEVSFDCMGKTGEEIIEMLGTPERVVTDVENNTILLYSYLPKYDDPYADRRPSFKSAQESTQIYLGKDNRCYYVKSNEQRTERFFDSKKTNGFLLGTLGAIALFLLGGLSVSIGG